MSEGLGNLCGLALARWRAVPPLTGAQPVTVMGHHIVCHHDIDEAFVRVHARPPSQRVAVVKTWKGGNVNNMW
eukprot:2143773-Amphidinium_carterae.1